MNECISVFQALIRLNKLGITMSPKSINKALDLLGIDYDLPLQKWKDKITDHLTKQCQMKQEEKELKVRKDELCQLADAGEGVHDQLVMVDTTLSSLQNEIKKVDEDRPSSFSIVLDNVDVRVLASDMTSENQNKDYHWCNHNVYLDCVNPTQLPNDAPIADLQHVPNSTFLPSLTDHSKLLSDFIVLIGRVLVQNLPAFEMFQDVVPLHIQHKYSDVLKNKTEMVSIFSK